MSPQAVEFITECFIKPKELPANPIIHFSPWDLALLSVNYIQKGLLFNKPLNFCITTFLQELKDSLSATLTHFYPFAGGLVTRKQESPHSYMIYLDCTINSGARFIHTVVDLSISDILSPTYVPSVVQSFFDHDRAVCYDGHTMSLLSIQVNELVDGIFIGCSANHMVSDGTSFWNFMKMWSQIFKSSHSNTFISSLIPVVHNRWIPDGYDPIINLRFTHHNQFIDRYETPPLKERIFHFSSESLSKLKAKANSQCHTTKISTLQALSALIWRCVTRARNVPNGQKTNCCMAVDNRSRLRPPLSNNYLGNAVQAIVATATAEDVLERELGWAALKLNEAVNNHDDKAVREYAESLMKSQRVYRMIDGLFDSFSVMMGSSPRFDMYGIEFGLGKALAIRSGYANKFDGKVSSYPGFHGGGSTDLEVCLPPHTMARLESDEEFMSMLA